MKQLRHQKWHKSKTYIKHFVMNYLLPHVLYQHHFKLLCEELSHYTPIEKQIIKERVAYYNQLSQSFSLYNATRIAAFKRVGHSSSYFLDLSVLLKYFPKDYLFAYQFGDVTTIPKQPEFVGNAKIF